MSFDLRIARRAQSYLGRSDMPTQQRRAARLEEIASDPYGVHTKQLKGGRGTRSSRVGGYRIIFSNDVASPAVEVEAIDPRGPIYRDLPS